MDTYFIPGNSILSILGIVEKALVCMKAGDCVLVMVNIHVLQEHLSLCRFSLITCYPFQRRFSIEVGSIETKA